jgi:flagellar P-ring protein precursor FlgI
MAAEFLKVLRIRKCGAILSAAALFALCIASPELCSADTQHKVLIRDITQIEGVRGNQLVGYGLVVGLNRTGDTQQTFFTVQTLANTLQRLGLQIPPGIVVVKNVAAVFVTATLPPFARPGMTVDVTVSSVGDAKSLEGGVLLLTALRATNGQIYGEAQGPLVLGGYSQGANGNSKTVNHVTTARIAGGATVEKDAAVDLTQFHVLSFLLQNADFTTARDIADAINKKLGKNAAEAVDSRRVDVNVSAASAGSVPNLIALIQNLGVETHVPAKVIVNERTGTIVMGGNVRLAPVSVIHGSLTIDVQTIPIVSQPYPDSNGTTRVVPETKLTTTDAPAQSIQLQAGANVDELIRGLHAIGATSRDVVSILQAIKEAGGLEAELEVI